MRVFFTRECFFDRKSVFIDVVYNTFSIVIEKQIHEPYSFYDNGVSPEIGHFFSRSDFYGTNVSSENIFNLILAAVNRVKALGTVYRLIEVD